LSLYGNSSQLYLDFVYSDYMKEHSEFKYLLNLIDMIDWSVVPDFGNKMDRTELQGSYYHFPKRPYLHRYFPCFCQ